MNVFPFDIGFICAECGAPTAVVWPPTEMVEGIERLLMLRPNPNNRNWETVETLADLMWENNAHGIFDHLTVSDTAIISDRHPALQGTKRTELGR